MHLLTLNFFKISITDAKFDRFCNEILRQIHHYIRKFILETTYMERILLVGDYPNLTSLELFNFGQRTGAHTNVISPTKDFRILLSTILSRMKEFLLPSIVGPDLKHISMILYNFLNR